MSVSERLVSALRDAVRPGLTRGELSRSWRPCLNPSGKWEFGAVLIRLEGCCCECLSGWNSGDDLKFGGEVVEVVVGG